MKTQYSSVEDPLGPGGTRVAIELVTQAEAMGLLDGATELGPLTFSAIDAVLARLAAAGVARGVIASLRRAGSVDAAELADGLRQVKDALDRSPLPEFEWTALIDLFGAEELAMLVGTSETSVNRYARGERATPDDIAERLHFVARIVADLRGAYNDIGIRRWFHRPRKALRGRAPARFLRGAWSPDDPGPTEVKQLSRALVFAPAT
ncbi:MAG: hypothetical protein ACRDKB_07825 [Actinomycetota bacterium]